MREEEMSEVIQKIKRNTDEMLKRTREKSKAYGGDPFWEYRKKKLLPERFEYGTNCFFDRIAEEQGEEFVQMVYEEFRKIPGSYTICQDPQAMILEEYQFCLLPI